MILTFLSVNSRADQCPAISRNTNGIGDPTENNIFHLQIKFINHGIFSNSGKDKQTHICIQLY